MGGSSPQRRRRNIEAMKWITPVKSLPRGETREKEVRTIDKELKEEIKGVGGTRGPPISL